MQKNNLNVHLLVTFIGGSRVKWEIRKFIAKSSQFIQSSTFFLIMAGME